MVRLWASVLGGYPRGRLARYTMRDLDSGALERYRGLVELERSSALVVGAQLASGMRYVVDGMLDWHDIFRPFAESWRNVCLDGIIRYFDNNFFYRIPVFRGEPEPDRLVLPSRVRATLPLAEPAGVKVVVPGPLTMMRLGRNESGLDDGELVARIASALALEVSEAVKAGASLVQVDEPFLSDEDSTRDDAKLAVEALREIKRAAGDVPVTLAVYFGSPRSEVYSELLEANADYVVVDLVDTPRQALQVIEAHGCGASKPVLGVIDSRQLYDDDYDRVRDLVKRAVSYCGELEEVGLTTSTWLDLVPLRFSLRKTMLLGRYTERLAVELGAELDMPITTRPRPYNP